MNSEATELVRIAQTLTADMSGLHRSYDIKVDADKVTLIFKWQVFLGNRPHTVEAIGNVLDDFEKDVQTDERKLGYHGAKSYVKFPDGEIYAFLTVDAARINYRGDPEGLYDWIEDDLRFTAENPARIKKQEARYLKMLLEDE